MNSEVVDFPLGRIIILCDKNRVVRIRFIRAEERVKRSSSPFSKKVAKEIREYLSGRRKEFTVEFHIDGSEFTKKVLRTVHKIPYGETRSYSDIAKAIGVSKGARAVGRVMATNPIPIIVPCHRVVNKDGKLGGYSGGIDVKAFLLNLERNVR